jgi:ABC-type dipeptide/oligopeptide/nickel transport system permease component
VYFIGRRLCITLITLFLVSLLTFCAFHLIPGDRALLALGIEATDEQVEAMRIEMGLDRSLPVQYLSWVKGFLSGSLGNSSRFRGASISGLVLERLPVTAALGTLSLLFILLISIPAVLLSVKREGSFSDRLMNTLTALNISLPGFFLGVLFIWSFGLMLRFFSPGNYIHYTEDLAGFLGYLLFPALAIAIPNAAIVIKFLRASVFRELRCDYVRTAQSKGNTRRGALYRHVLKNAVIPAITLLGMIIGEIFAGSIVIEQVFTIPGVGRLLFASITSRDYPLVQTLVVYIAFIVILANTLVDIAIQIIDPRIRIG